jgi:hypothetical protein
VLESDEEKTRSLADRGIMIVAGGQMRDDEIITRHRRPVAQRIAEAERRLLRLQASAGITSLAAASSTDLRAADTRERVVLGGAVLAGVRDGHLPRDGIAALLDQTILNVPTRAFMIGRGWPINGRNRGEQ